MKTEGKLPVLFDLEPLINFFDPFMVKVMDMALNFKQDDTIFEIDEIEESANFNLKIASRILVKDKSNKSFQDVI